MKFLDQAKIYIKSGNGGPGCLSFRREKNLPNGGPNGGNGGRGGDVLAVAVDNLNTLIDFRFQQHVKAKNGLPGEGNNRSGAGAANLKIKVPTGTQILSEDAETLIYDLDTPGQRVRLATGGDGGFGNAHFKSSTNQAPRRADPGWPGEEHTLILRLKLIADIGIIGLPNAGKSTFLAAVSRARPKIADYPFTTLVPNLGVVHIDETEFVIADIPGLIEGAHEGSGLGDRFLGHVERCSALLHLVDGTIKDVGAAYQTVRREVNAYASSLADKPEIVALNKCDSLTEDAIVEKSAALARAASTDVQRLSGVSGLGRDELLRALHEEITAARTRSIVEGPREYAPGGAR